VLKTYTVRLLSNYCSSTRVQLQRDSASGVDPIDIEARAKSLHHDPSFAHGGAGICGWGRAPLMRRASSA
jgi:hypothetical protein